MSKPRWQRALISFAGPAVNLIFPIFLLTGLFTFVGIPYSAYLDAPVKIAALPSAQVATSPLKVGDTVLSVNGVATPSWEQAFRTIKLAPAGQSIKMEVEEGGARRTVEVTPKEGTAADRVLGYVPIRPILDQVVPGTPADKAGLREGDTITVVNGNKILYWEQFVEAVQSSNGQPIALDVDRKGQTVHTTVTPKKDIAESGESVYQIGVLRSDETAYKRVAFSEGVRVAGASTEDTIVRTVDVVGKLLSGRVSIKQLQGPVEISHQAGQAVRKGPLNVISLMVLISINLGILNLLPIPILDGGNILLLAIEGIMRRDLSLSFKERFVQVGLVFLLVIFAIVMYNDILRRITSHS
jgi:regulator of sigma E protease